MPTKQKEGVINELSEKLSKSTAVVLIETQAMNMKEQINIRKKFRSEGLDIQVVKNTLLRIAGKKAGVALDANSLNRPTAIIIGYGDETGPAKTLVDLMKTVKTISIKSGAMKSTQLSAQDVEELAKIPGKQELRGQVVGSIIGPLQETHGLLSAPIRDLVGVLRNYAEKQGGAF